MSNTTDFNIAYIALGSNMGDRNQWLMQALDALEKRDGITITAVSAIYETDPVGYTDQDAFLNMVIQVSTSYSPHELLQQQQEIESELGRVRQVRWGPRTIDLDLLLYDNIALETEQLILPHPRMMERAFVLVPLRDVLSDDHVLYREVEQVAKEALQSRKEGITIWKTINWLNV